MCQSHLWYLSDDEDLRVVDEYAIAALYKYPFFITIRAFGLKISKQEEGMHAHTQVAARPKYLLLINQIFLTFLFR